VPCEVVLAAGVLPVDCVAPGGVAVAVVRAARGLSHAPRSIEARSRRAIAARGADGFDLLNIYGEPVGESIVYLLMLRIVSRTS
jgi:hypothetical protein